MVVGDENDVDWLEEAKRAKRKSAKKRDDENETRRARKAERTRSQTHRQLRNQTRRIHIPNRPHPGTRRAPLLKNRIEQHSQIVPSSSSRHRHQETSMSQPKSFHLPLPNFPIHILYTLLHRVNPFFWICIVRVRDLSGVGESVGEGFEVERGTMGGPGILVRLGWVEVGWLVVVQFGTRGETGGEEGDGGDEGRGGGS